MSTTEKKRCAAEAGLGAMRNVLLEKKLGPGVLAGLIASRLLPVRNPGLVAGWVGFSSEFFQASEFPGSLLEHQESAKLLRRP